MEHSRSSIQNLFKPGVSLLPLACRSISSLNSKTAERKRPNTYQIVVASTRSNDTLCTSTSFAPAFVSKHNHSSLSHKICIANNYNTTRNNRQVVAFIIALSTMANFQLETNVFGLVGGAVQEDASSSGRGADSMVRSKTSAMKMPVSKKNNSKKNRMPPNYVPSKNAVICGRGKICTTNPGNRKLRALIKENLAAYGKATNKVDKTEIVSSIMDNIRKDCDNDPAFVKKEEGTWWEVDDAFAREKIGCIFRDSLFTKYRSSTKAKLARRKQQMLEEEEVQRQHQEQAQRQQKMNAAMLFGGLGMDTMNMNAKQLQLQQLMNSNVDLGSNLLAAQQQSQHHHMGMFSNSLGFPQHSARRDLLAHAPSMMGLPGGANPAYMEPSMALGEAFDLLHNLQPAANQSAQLFGSLQQQQQQKQRESYFKDLFGVFAGGQQPELSAQAQAQGQADAAAAASAAAKPAAAPTQKRKRRRKNGDGDLESLPDDISGIFD